MYFVFLFCRLRLFFATNCKDSASRAQYKKSWLFFIAEAPPILSKDSASRLFVRRLSYQKIVQAAFRSPPILSKDSASRFFVRRLSYQKIVTNERKI